MKASADDGVDDRATTPETFAPLMDEFAFTIDVAASKHNTKCPRFYHRGDNGLAQPWAGERVWCNPPFSNIEPWIRKAWDEHTQCGVIVMLLPANRTEQRWWQTLVEPHRDNGGALEVRFLPGRIRFIMPGDADVKPNARPPFGCCLLIWRGGTT